MTISLEQLANWLVESESENLEFKEAKTSYEFETLVQYCVALANEGGGHIVLGVSDKRPRRVVGSLAFQNLERTKAGIFERLHFRVDAEAIVHPEGRVVVFSVPSRPLGSPIEYRGAYWMRSGDSLVPMTSERLKRIFEELEPDFSAQTCDGATFDDLDPDAIEVFRRKWHRHSGNDGLPHRPVAQLLEDAELTRDGKVTVAALVLLGTDKGLGRMLAQSEVVFEYRSSEASGPASQRKEYRKGVFLFLDDLWQTINLRNDVQHYQDGLFVRDVPTFNETVVREAINNAVCHRDYRLVGSIFVRQYARKMEIVSPGGLPAGITLGNILDRQSPRNRRIAEIFTKCGLVERSGQGVNLMFEESIKEAKLTPDFTGTDEYQVSVTVHGDIQAPRFLQFLERIGREQMASFSTDDFLVLDLVYRERPVPERLKTRAKRLHDLGIVERVGRGKATKFILARRFYKFLGEKGVYTRKRGLDRETNKALLLKHIEDNAREGSPLQDLLQVLPALSREQVQSLLRSLKLEGRIHSVGRTKAGRWFPGSSQD